MNKTSVRQNRVADLLKKEISDIIQTQVRDPRIGFITITSVDVSPDLRNAKIYIHVYGTEKDRKDSMIGLKRASSFIKSDLASRISLRRVPDIYFIYDKGLDQYERIDKILKEFGNGIK